MLPQPIPLRADRVIEEPVNSAEVDRPPTWIAGAFRPTIPVLTLCHCNRKGSDEQT